MNAIATRAGTSLAPTTWAEARQFSELLANSDMVPRDYRGKPANVMVAVQWGAELGLGPLQAIQNIAVINGKPSIYGDAALALVRGHPACEWVREGVEGDGDARHGFCEVQRRNAPQPERRTFSVADAKRAGLWGKQGPWQQYPERMLQMRARGFAIRDVFPDALRGVITAEEAEDMPPEPRHVPNMAERTIPDGLPAPRQPAPAGSMRAEAEAMQQKRPVLTPDLTLAEVPARAWKRAVTKALNDIHDLDTLNGWWQGTAPLLADPEEKADVEALVVERRAEVAEAPA